LLSGSPAAELFGRARGMGGRNIMCETRYRSSGSLQLRRIGLVIALLGPGASIAAEVVGTVLPGNSPVADVAVSLGQFTARSDAVGRFLIRNVPPGGYQLKCGNSAPLQVQIRDGLNQVKCRAG
jgi:hypothetical protein